MGVSYSAKSIEEHCARIILVSNGEFFYHEDLRLRDHFRLEEFPHDDVDDYEGHYKTRVVIIKRHNQALTVLFIPENDTIGVSAGDGGAFS